MKTLIFALLAASLVLAGCSPFSKVYSEPEPGVNLYRYHTYDWLPEAEPEQKSPGSILLSRETATRIRASVDAEMAGYGFKICTDNPDLQLHYHVVVENKVYYQRDRQCLAGEHGRHGYCNRVNPVYFHEGTLMLDFLDARTGNQVWRGAAVGVLQNTTEAERERLIQKAVREIFKKFPEQKRPSGV